MAPHGVPSVSMLAASKKDEGEEEGRNRAVRTEDVDGSGTARRVVNCETRCHMKSQV